SRHDRGCAETIPYACSRPVPMTPSGKTCIVRFKILAAKHAVPDGAIVHQQNAAVPDIRFLSLERVKIRVDFCPPFVRKSPRLRRETKIMSVNMKDQWRLHHHTRASAVKMRLGFTISSCAATN